MHTKHADELADDGDDAVPFGLVADGTVVDGARCASPLPCTARDPLFRAPAYSPPMGGLAGGALGDARFRCVSPPTISARVCPYRAQMQGCPW